VVPALAAETAVQQILAAEAAEESS